MATVLICIILYIIIGAFVAAIEQSSDRKDVFDMSNDADIASSVVIWPVTILLYLKSLLFYLSPYVFVRVLLNIYIAIRVWFEVGCGIVKRIIRKH